MSLPVKITIHRGLLSAMPRVITILIVGYLTIAAITVLIDRQPQLILNVDFWLTNWTKSGFIVLFIAIPISLSPFIRPADDTRLSRFTQGLVIMAMSTPVFLWLMMQTLSLSANTNGSENAYKTSVALLVPYYFINAAIYLPGVFGWGERS